jgi:hypothetical protein
MSIGAPPQGSPQAMLTPGSLTSLMDGLTTLQATVKDHPLLAGFDEPLNLYRWQPNAIELPGLWNWMLPSTSEIKDLASMRDHVNISTRIGTRMTDVGDRMNFLEAAADAYRAVIDPSFWDGQTTPPALKGYATWALRTSMQTFSADVGGVPVIGFEFIQNFQLVRRIA